MEDFFRAIWLDIKERRNLELYLILAAIIPIFLADIFGLQTQSALFEIILASLAILVYGLIEQRREQSTTAEKLDKIEKLLIDNQTLLTRSLSGHVQASRFFSTEQRISRQSLSGANVIYLSGVNLTRTLREYLHILGERLVAGAHIRVIIVDYQSDTALKELIAKSVESAKIENRQAALKAASTTVELLAQTPGAKGKLDVGFLPYIPHFGLTLIEPDSPNGICSVALYHHRSLEPTIKFQLTAADDPEWYNFFRKQYENLWLSCRVHSLL
jgi:hypothetical protein